MNSFLESDLRLFLAPPPGLYVPPGYACLVKKGLYGLCQSGHRWAVMKASTLTELGFLRSAAEPCLWIRNDARGVLITGVIVDDFVITDSSLQLCDEFAAQLMKIWDCTYIGDMEWCINLRIRRDRERRRMTIDQSEYVDAVAEKFGLSKCTPVLNTSGSIRQTFQIYGPS